MLTWLYIDLDPGKKGQSISSKNTLFFSWSKSILHCMVAAASVPELPFNDITSGVNVPKTLSLYFHVPVSHSYYVDYHCSEYCFLTRTPETSCRYISTSIITFAYHITTRFVLGIALQKVAEVVVLLKHCCIFLLII